MSEDAWPTKIIGRRVAASLRRVLSVGSRGSRLDALIDGPYPEAPAAPVLDDVSDSEKAFVERHLGFDADSAAQLGGWIEPAHDDATGGKADYVRFPRFWRSWMARQTPDTLGALDALARREIERRVKKRIWRRAREGALVAAVATFAALHWGWDQVAWFKEKFPLMQETWRWLLGLLK